MITRLPGNILNIHGQNVLSFAKPSTKSWFHQIRDLCLIYNLPHPLHQLIHPQPKDIYKQMIHKHVVSHWEEKLREEAASKSSLMFFHPEYYSLTKPHPLWTTAGSDPYQVTMATVQAAMLSG